MHYGAADVAKESRLLRGGYEIANLSEVLFFSEQILLDSLPPCLLLFGCPVNGHSAFAASFCLPHVFLLLGGQLHVIHQPDKP